MMNKNNNSTTTGGIGFTGLLQVAFIVLKLCHVINWSWLWVLCPLWISAGILIIALAVIFIAFSAKKS